MKRSTIERMQDDLRREVLDTVRAATAIPGVSLPDRKKRKVARVLEQKMNGVGAEISLVLARHALEQSKEDEAEAWDHLRAAHTNAGRHVHDPDPSYEESVEELKAAQSRYDECRAEVERQQLRVCRALEDLGAARCPCEE